MALKMEFTASKLLYPPPYKKQGTLMVIMYRRRCAANFSFAQLAKRKSLGRSKPATNSQAQALQHTWWNISTISKSYRTAFYRNKMSTTRCE